MTDIRRMKAEDIATVVPFYVDYYNRSEGGCWTPEKAERRIRQVFSVDGSYSLLMEEDGEAVGFLMGYFKPYDDLTSFTVEEILIRGDRQHRGLGKRLLAEAETHARAHGAAGIELIAVNDEGHRTFYGNAGFHAAKNHLPMVKWFD